MSESGPGRVSIHGREFELGAVYAPRKPRPGLRNRELIAFEPAASWCGGRVLARIISRQAIRRPPCQAVSGIWWSRWAGERIAGAEE